MKQTANFGLSQWEKSDRILMENFNSDNLKTDAALQEQSTALAGLTAAVGLRGNCQVYAAVYTGNGAYGEDSPTSHTFPRKPIFVCIMDNSGNLLPMMQGNTTTLYRSFDASFANIVWSGNSVSWSGASAKIQMNQSGLKYTILALMAADE